MTRNTPSMSAEAEKLLDAFKRAAKLAQKSQQPTGEKPLAWYQDRVAKAFHYINWSQLHKHVRSTSSSTLDEIRRRALLHPELAIFLNKPRQEVEAMSSLDLKSAKEDIRSYAREHFSPLNDFAFFDSESESGFAWPEVDLDMELQDAFADQYPIDLINEVAADLLLQHGPWGVEDYGPDEE